MLKILLCCAGGMSTSLLVEHMKEAANEKGVECKIWAVGEASVKDQGEFDILLLGPQIRYKLNSFKKEFGATRPVEMINMRDYGQMNGKAVFEWALTLLNK